MSRSIIPQKSQQVDVEKISPDLVLSLQKNYIVKLSTQQYTIAKSVRTNRVARSKKFYSPLIKIRQDHRMASIVRNNSVIEIIHNHLNGYKNEDIEKIVKDAHSEQVKIYGPSYYFRDYKEYKKEYPYFYEEIENLSKYWIDAINETLSDKEKEYLKDKKLSLTIKEGAIFLDTQTRYIKKVNITNYSRPLPLKQVFLKELMYETIYMNNRKIPINELIALLNSFLFVATTSSVPIKIWVKTINSVIAKDDRYSIITGAIVSKDEFYIKQQVWEFISEIFREISSSQQNKLSNKIAGLLT